MMVKRIVLFLVVNLLVVVAISLLLSLFNVAPYLAEHGLNIRSLLIFCFTWGMLGALVSLALSRKMAKWLMNVKLVGPQGQHSEFYQMVARLSRNANLPNVPEVGIFESPQMNAFATGPTKRRALVAVSTALLSKMERQELEAVLAHEISHISNGDMVTMTLLQGIVNAFVMFLARILAYAISVAGRSSQEKRSVSGSFYFLTTLFEIIFMILGSMVVATFSRYREYRADYGGAILTRKEQMIGALQRLQTSRAIGQPSQKQSMNALMISMPTRQGFLRLFATHPSLEDRIARLKKIP